MHSHGLRLQIIGINSNKSIVSKRARVLNIYMIMISLKKVVKVRL